MKITMTSYGKARSEAADSEDSFDVKSWGETVIAVVADGVGGARAGREASQRIVQSLMHDYADRPRSWSPQKALGEFTRLLNQRLYQDSMQRYGGPELVSTLAVAVIEGDRLFGLNVGDSPVYLARAGQLQRLSIDHVAGAGGFRHVLSRAVGLGPEVEPHFFETDLVDGDMALLCTDGVSNVLDEEMLGARLEQRSAARSIITIASEKVTPDLLDDMSAVVLDIVETGKLRSVTEQPLQIPNTLRRGDVIEGYTLVKPFQHSDRVWLAEREGRRFSLKFAPIEAETNEAILNAFTRETWNATRLKADFFPSAFVPENTSTRCYVMEFIQAPSLRSLLASRPLGVDEAIALGKFLLTASQYLLRFDLVHGDIKPENILVESGYDSIQFKMVDFGSIAELFSIHSRAGTASYLAPERFLEAPISERTEVFSIAVTIYQALTGTLPFGEIERFQTPHFHPAKDPITLNHNVPGWLAAVLLRATSPDPARRYANFSEMLFDLEHPREVEPFHRKDAPLIERDPLLFYRIGFFTLLALSIYLLIRLVSAGVPLP